MIGHLLKFSVPVNGLTKQSQLAQDTASVTLAMSRQLKPVQPLSVLQMKDRKRKRTDFLKLEYGNGYRIPKRRVWQTYNHILNAMRQGRVLGS